MTLDDYEITGSLGSKGKFGGVQVGYVKARPEISVTIKRIEKYGERLLPLLQKVKEISHPSIAPILDVESVPSVGLLVARKKIEGTDLKTIFTTKSLYRRVDEKKFIQAGCAILRGLEKLHAAGVIHRDIKPSNIIIPHAEGEDVTKADFSKAVIIDFEQSSPYPDNSGVRSSFALVYSPPEMLLKYNSLVGPWSDFFALSVMLFQLIMGKAPYSDCNPEILVNLQLTYPMKQPVRMADDLYACLRKAAYKEPFRIPPRRMSQQEIEQTLRKGVQGRYRSAEEMLRDLEQVGEPFKKVSWIQKVLGE
ncbi:MAG: protein kinase [Bacteroidales bacterium]|nr:protein kinase [Bacteroidales bacterium]